MSKEEKLIEAIKFTNLAVNHLTLRLAEVIGLDSAYQVSVLLNKSEDLMEEVKKEIAKE